MKLRTKGYLFIGLPLMVQLVITGVLFVNAVSLERRIDDEAFAKQVLSLANQQQQIVAESLISIVAARYTDIRIMKKGVVESMSASASIAQQLRELKKRDSKNAQEIEDFATAIDHMTVMIKDQMDPNKPTGVMNTFYRELRESFYNLEFFVTYRNVYRTEKNLRAKFIKQIHEAGPDAMREQERLRFALATALVINVASAIALAIYYGQSTVGRLNMLMSNVKAFSDGVLDMRKVGGNDEISALNEQFKTMAEKRLEAEQERGAVLQAVSHDIRGPVGTLNMAISTLLSHHSKMNEADISLRLTRLAGESARLVDLCNAFLDLEKFDNSQLNLELKEVNLLLLCETAREAVEGLTNETEHVIEIDCDPKIELKCDEKRIMQVLINLLSNAIKFSPARSTIYVSGSRDATAITLSIRDEGSGLTAEEADTLFEKFSQLKNAKGHTGSGLGLWICKRLVELHGATISCQSTVGVGTEFSIKFPQSDSGFSRNS